MPVNKGTYTELFEKNSKQLDNRLLGTKVSLFILLSLVGYLGFTSESIKLTKIIELIISFSTLSLVVFPSALSLWLKYQPTVVKFSNFDYKLSAHTKVSKVIVDQLSQIFTILPLCFIALLIDNISYKRWLFCFILLVLFDLIRQLISFIGLALHDYIRVESNYEHYIQDQERIAEEDKMVAQSKKE